jgi:hypothetical protein
VQSMPTTEVSFEALTLWCERCQVLIAKLARNASLSGGLWSASGPFQRNVSARFSLRRLYRAG